MARLTLGQKLQKVASDRHADAMVYINRIERLENRLRNMQEDKDDQRFWWMHTCGGTVVWAEPKAVSMEVFLSHAFDKPFGVESDVPLEWLTDDVCPEQEHGYFVKWSDKLTSAQEDN